MTEPTAPGEEIGGRRVEPAATADRLLEWHGDLTELYRIFLVNIVLTVITLGVYYFWGKTRIRRYVWAHVAPAGFPGDRLEYRGKGSEIFLAWLVALVLLGAAAAGVYALYRGLGEAALLLVPLLVLGVLFLAPLAFHTAKFAARRYILSRTRWRGIRFAQTGSVWWMGVYTAVRRWAQYLTMHVTRPFYEEAKRRCTIDATWFGDRRMRYTGKPDALMGPWLGALVGIAGAAVGAMVAGTLISLVAGVAMAGGDGTAAEVVVVMAVQWAISGLALVGALYFWYGYRARSLAHAARHTRLEGLDFSFECAGPELFRFELVNWVAIIASLGLAYPWVKVRRIRFTADRLRVRGHLDPAELRQASGAAPRVGEGFVEAFGLDYPILGVIEI